MKINIRNHIKQLLCLIFSVITKKIRYDNSSNNEMGESGRHQFSIGSGETTKTSFVGGMGSLHDFHLTSLGIFKLVIR